MAQFLPSKYNFTCVKADSRYKLAGDRYQVMVQDFNCVQMCALPTEAERRWVSGCNNHYKFVLSA